MKTPVRVTITGAAGQIGYQLAFRVASGQMLGSEQPVILQLLEIPPALPALQGVVMELDDCAFSTLVGIVATDEPDIAFKDSDYALLVGARPRGPGMERKDLLQANAEIFSVQGKAMNDHASRDIRVLVVGNPANTNALIASSNAPDIDSGNFTAMTELAVLNFIARGIACFPRSKYIHVSYSGDLAHENSSKIKSTILTPEFQDLWPMKVRTDSKGKKRWYTEAGGGMMAAAAGGQIIGPGALIATCPAV